nr:MAG TPA: hypothetical protein [Microviridae sp.]
MAVRMVCLLFCGVLFLHLYYTPKTYTCQAEFFLDGRPVGAGAPNEKDGVAFRDYAVQCPLLAVLYADFRFSLVYPRASARSPPG